MPMDPPSPTGPWTHVRFVAPHRMNFFELRPLLVKIHSTFVAMAGSRRKLLTVPQNAFAQPCRTNSRLCSQCPLFERGHLPPYAILPARSSNPRRIQFRCPSSARYFDFVFAVSVSPVGIAQEQAAVKKKKRASLASPGVTFFQYLSAFPHSTCPTLHVDTKKLYLVGVLSGSLVDFAHPIGSCPGKEEKKKKNISPCSGPKIQPSSASTASLDLHHIIV